MKKTLLAVVIMLSLATMAVGSTVAGFSDTERSLDNVFEAASLDLLVAKADGTFREDQPWGAGLEPVFYIDCAEICETYVTNLFLWNIGSTDGTARLHIRLTEDTASIAGTTTLRILYGDPAAPILDVTQSLQILDCSPVTLGPLPAEEIRQLRLEIHPKGPGENTVPFELEFSIEFQLIQVGHSYSDTETSTAHLESCGEGCTPGFWQGGNGKKLWNKANDPDWTDAGGQGNNPFTWTTPFNSFFTSHPDLDGLTMMDLVGTGGGPNPVRKAARSLVAAYLNASFGITINYPLNTTELHDLWDAAVATGPPTFGDLHTMLDDYNNLGCTID
ncbi:hypothetical protein ES707_14790 [subsurface metagenome]